ncbi:MAG: hypothetical protein ACI4JR_09470 [Acutalibacteraceae bacterium]
MSVLGTRYSIKRKNFDKDAILKENNFAGYCDSVLKEIVVADASTLPGTDNMSANEKLIFEKATLRHEIVHAFLNESGLEENTLAYNGGWSRNEEMVDWIALQGPKLYRAWIEADAI